MPVVGGIGVAMALVTIKMNQRIARMRATLDLVERNESSEHYRKLFRAFDELGNNENILNRLKNPQTEADRLLTDQVLAYLNHYELVAIGCEKGILDEEFYAKWMRTQLVGDWHTAKEYIFHKRAPSATERFPSIYIEFEALARRFETRSERGARFNKFRGRAKTLLKTWRGRRRH